MRQVHIKTLPSDGLSTDATRRPADLSLADVVHEKTPQSDISVKGSEIMVSKLCELSLCKGVKAKKKSIFEIDKRLIAGVIISLLGRKLGSDVTGANSKRSKLDAANCKTMVDLITMNHNRVIVEGGNGTTTLIGGLSCCRFRGQVLKIHLPFFRTQ